jgi:hypothetical protein
MRGMSIRNPFNPFLPLSAARQRAPADDDDKKQLAEWRRQGALAERERIRAILTVPVAARQPRLAEVYAFDSDTPATDAIAMMEASDSAARQSNAKATADKIIHMGKVRRGEVATDATSAPKVFVAATAEGILAAARKRDGK